MKAKVSFSGQNISLLAYQGFYTNRTDKDMIYDTHQVLLIIPFCIYQNGVDGLFRTKWCGPLVPPQPLRGFNSALSID